MHAADGDAAATLKRLLDEVGRVVVGQRALVEGLLVGLLAGGHVLVEGVPGLAKTTAVRTLAQALGLGFRRIQFTPDLLPGDLVGTPIYHPDERRFAVRKGPIFAPVLLADEINRAPAKVQSALLEAMEERQVTIGDESFALPAPVLRDGDPESDRAGGHLSAARGADRPLPAEARRRLPERGRGARDRGARRRRRRRASTPSPTPRSSRRCARRRRGPRRRRRQRLRRAAGAADSRRTRRRGRRLAAREPLPGARGARARAARRARLRHALRREARARPTCCATASCSATKPRPTACAPERSSTRCWQPSRRRSHVAPDGGPTGSRTGTARRSHAGSGRDRARGAHPRGAQPARGGGRARRHLAQRVPRRRHRVRGVAPLRARRRRARDRLERHRAHRRAVREALPRGARVHAAARARRLGLDGASATTGRSKAQTAAHAAALLAASAAAGRRPGRASSRSTTACAREIPPGARRRPHLARDPRRGRERRARRTALPTSASSRTGCARTRGGARWSSCSPTSAIPCAGARRTLAVLGRRARSGGRDRRGSARARTRRRGRLALRRRRERPARRCVLGTRTRAPRRVPRAAAARGAARSRAGCATTAPNACGSTPTGNPLRALVRFFRDARRTPRRWAAVKRALAAALVARGRVLAASLRAPPPDTPVDAAGRRADRAAAAPRRRRRGDRDRRS